MNKLAALSALVLLAQLINASPVAETSGKSLIYLSFHFTKNLFAIITMAYITKLLIYIILTEAERALDSLTFVSKSGPERQDRERRAAAARSGIFYSFTKLMLVWFLYKIYTKWHRNYQTTAFLFSTFLGLKCYNQEGSSRRIELECDLLGGADYCAKVTGPNVSAKTCAIDLISDAFKELNLVSAGCRTHGDFTFCLCSGSLCNA